MSLPVPLNDLLGPAAALGLVSAAVITALVLGVYRCYLKRQQDAWAGR